MTGYEAHERSTLNANIYCQIHPQACLLKEAKATRGDLDQTSQLVIATGGNIFTVGLQSWHLLTANDTGIKVVRGNYVV